MFVACASYIEIIYKNVTLKVGGVCGGSIMVTFSKFLLPLSLASLAACAASPTGDETDKKDPLDDPRVGEEVRQLCFAGSINGFSEWDGDNGLILRKGVNDRFLVTFIASCPPADNAMRVGVDPRSGSCLRRGDRLIVSSTLFPDRNDTVFDTQRCTIGAIYQWNEDATEEETAKDSETE